MQIRTLEDAYDMAVNKSDSYQASYGIFKASVKAFLTEHKQEVQWKPYPCIFAPDGNDGSHKYTVVYPWDDARKPRLLCPICGDMKEIK